MTSDQPSGWLPSRSEQCVGFCAQQATWIVQPVIIRHKHKGQFVIVPNGIFRDPRLSVVAKGLLAYLLSLPASWEVRHDQLHRELGIGRKLLDRAFRELIEAGYVTRDEAQGRDEYNRFTTLNYVVSDIASRPMADVHSPRRTKPQRKRSSGNNKEVIKTDLTNPFSKSLPTLEQESKQAQQWQYSAMGQRAAAIGQCAVIVGSEPYEAWRRFRGEDGIPGFTDRAIYNGRVHDVVWLPSLYPPRRQVQQSEEGGGCSEV